MNRKFFVCDCKDAEHQLSVVWFDDEDTAYIEFPLASRPLWFRLWYGLRYILFGYKCKYGDFDNIMLEKEKAKELGELLLAIADNPCAETNQ